MAKNTNLTMAGLRLAEEKMKQEQKPLTAITVALAGKENKTSIPVTMEGLRQLDRMAASNMPMGGLKPVQKNETGSQAARGALAKVQVSNNKNGYMHPEFLEDTTIPYAAGLGGEFWWISISYC